MPDGDLLLNSVAPADLPDPTESMRLVVEAQAGDGDALNALLERYQDRLRRVIRIRLGARVRAGFETMDIVQQTNLVAARKIGDLELRDTASILNWLARIAVHQITDARDYLQAQRRDRRREVYLDRADRDGDARGDPVDPGSSPSAVAHRGEVRAILDDVVAGLAADHREVILLRDYHGGSWEWVSRQMEGRGAEACKKLYQRAWIKVRAAARPRLQGLLPD